MAISKMIVYTLEQWSTIAAKTVGGHTGNSKQSLWHLENGEEYLLGLIMGSNILYPPNHHWSKLNRYLEATALYLGKILSISNSSQGAQESAGTKPGEPLFSVDRSDTNQSHTS